MTEIDLTTTVTVTILLADTEYQMTLIETSAPPNYDYTGIQMYDSDPLEKGDWKQRVRYVLIHTETLETQISRNLSGLHVTKYLRDNLTLDEADVRRFLAKRLFGKES